MGVFCWQSVHLRRPWVASAPRYHGRCMQRVGAEGGWGAVVSDPAAASSSTSSSRKAFCVLGVSPLQGQSPCGEWRHWQLQCLWSGKTMSCTTSWSCVRHCNSQWVCLRDRPHPCACYSLWPPVELGRPAWTTPDHCPSASSEWFLLHVPGAWWNTSAHHVHPSTAQTPKDHHESIWWHLWEISCQVLQPCLLESPSCWSSWSHRPRPFAAGGPWTAQDCVKIVHVKFISWAQKPRGHQLHHWVVAEAFTSHDFGFTLIYEKNPTCNRIWTQGQIACNPIYRACPSCIVSGRCGLWWPPFFHPHWCADVDESCSYRHPASLNTWALPRRS